MLPAILGFIFLIILLYEFRVRRPDQIVLFESRGTVKQRRGKFYPRHFSLAVPATIHSTSVKVEAEAKGKLPVIVQIALSCAASPSRLNELIRVGGWSTNVLAGAAAELETLVQSYIKEFAQQFEMEELNAEKLSQQLNKKLGQTVAALGLDIISCQVQSVDPLDEEIAEAMRKQEAARIMEQTETANQKARVAAARARIKADEQIAQTEHDLALKKLALEEKQQQKEALLQKQRVEEEIKRRKMQMEVEKKEVELLKDNPELLILSPQMARLAEASQSLPNAKTVVTLSPEQAERGSQVITVIQELLQKMMERK